MKCRKKNIYYESSLLKTFITVIKTKQKLKTCASKCLEKASRWGL